MESLGIVRPAFWKGRKVAVTGHTGFKGAWLSLWLHHLGCDVHGLSLPPSTQPSLFDLAKISSRISSSVGDIRDLNAVSKWLTAVQPEIVFHLAAQALVRPSYDAPVETFAANVMGTAHVLEAARTTSSVHSIVVITSDKCYENREWQLAYRESDPFGGHDPYSASKGCAEIVTASYRNSFFKDRGLASARAGNVIGGGDWSAERLIPDCMRALAAGEEIVIRNPASVRPWQHVLDALRGYLLLAQSLSEQPVEYSRGWNFGPSASDSRPVCYVADAICRLWGEGARWRTPSPGAVTTRHEAGLLRLDSTLAQTQLHWKPVLVLQDALRWTTQWYASVARGADAYTETKQQLEEFTLKETALHER